MATLLRIVGSTLGLLATTLGPAVPLRGAGGQSIDPSKLYARLSPSVVVVRVGNEDFSDSIGSGVVIAERTVMEGNYPTRLVAIATCWHVLAKGVMATVDLPGDTGVYEGLVAYADPTADLAILVARSESRANKVVTCSPSRPKPGERLYVIGSPSGLTGTITEGLMSQARSTRGGVMYQLSAPVEPGHSGAPVFNAKGRLVGIIVSRGKESPSLAFALPVARILAAIPSLRKEPRGLDAFRRLRGWLAPTAHTARVRLVVRVAD